MVSGDSGRGLNESSEILLAQTTTNQIYDTVWWFNAAVWHQQGKQYWILTVTNDTITVATAGSLHKSSAIIFAS